MLRGLVLLVLLGRARAQRPLVTVPTLLGWGEEARVVVTPLRSAGTVDLRLKVQAADGRTALLRREARPTGRPTTLQLTPPGQSPLYNVTVSVTGYSDFKVTIQGAVALEDVYLYTEKHFYKPSDTVTVKSLPISKTGTIFNGLIHYYLEFPLPSFGKPGKWRVTAIADGYDKVLSSTAFNVQEYVLPKFLLHLTAARSGDASNPVQLTLHSRVPNGAAMNGTVDLYCTLGADRHNVTNNPSHLLAKGIVRNGFWSQMLSAKRCGHLLERQALWFVAKVADLNLETEVIATEWDPFKADIELIPTRPALDPFTETAVVFVRPLSPIPDKSRLDVRWECVAYTRNNGRVKHLRAESVDDHFVVQFEVLKDCLVHLIKAQIVNEDGSSSKEEILALPYIAESEQLEFRWIQPTEPRKLFYREGEVFSADLAQLNDLNYAVSLVRSVHSDILQVVCEGNVTSLSEITSRSTLAVPIESSMHGICTLYVYSASATNNKVDMWSFIVLQKECPQSSRVGQPLKAELKGVPGALALFRVADARLAAMLETVRASKRHLMFFMREFEKPDAFSVHGSYMAGVFKLTDFFKQIRDVCYTAGDLVVNCDMPIKLGYSAVSDSCLTNLKLRCTERPTLGQSPLTEQATTSLPVVNLAGIPGLGVWKKPKTELMTNRQSEPVVQQILARPMQNDALNEEQEDPADLIRDFFPEVWMFEDYVVPSSGQIDLDLRVPHSVTEWVFESHFWTQGSHRACLAPAQNLQIRRNIYMTVDMPQQVYENETIQARITVTGDHHEDHQLSICFNFFSPVVCGDVGTNGGLGEAEYSQVDLRPGQPVVKSIFVKFLRVGDHNLTFKLVDNPMLSVGRWHCRDDNLRVHDRIQLAVRVARRVDMDEHFKKMVMQKVHVPAALLMFDATGSKPAANVIRFDNSAFDNGTVLTTVKLDSDEKVFDSLLEISEWEMGVDFDPSQLASSRSRTRRSAGVSFGLGTIIKELSQLTYQHNRHDDTQRSEEYGSRVAELLSELLTYSDCASAFRHESCGFGEYRSPSMVSERDPMLSILATSLLCEQRTAEQFICGPMEYFAQIAKDPASLGQSYVDTLGFSTKKDRDDFLLALISWVGRDCRMYTCVNNSSAWVDIYSLRFDDMGQVRQDVRLDAALARVVTRSTSSRKRNILFNKANLRTSPLWKVKLDGRPNESSKQLRDSSQRVGRDGPQAALFQSADVLANSLGVLAFIADPSDYNFWKGKMDLESVSKWLVEQQDSDGQYETAASTYFGLRALSVFKERQTGSSHSRNLVGNVSVSGEQNNHGFNNSDLPLALGLPNSAKEVQVSLLGDSAVVLGVRVLTEKRRRSKRDPTDEYPVSLSISQRRAPNSGLFLQTITIIPHSAMLTSLEIEHGLFTGFHSKPGWLSILDNSGYVLSPPQFSSTGAHFVLAGLTKDTPTRYTLTVAEPGFGYTPDNLAPIAVTARKNGVVGMVVVGAADLSFGPAASDAFPMRRRRRRHQGSLMHQILEAQPESNVVETVCVEDGVCSCAEVSCETECTNCTSASLDQLCAEFKERGFAVVFRIMSTKTEQRSGASYDVYDVKILEWYGSEKEPAMLSVWLRDCNAQCHLMTRHNADKARYLLIGKPEGIFDGGRADETNNALLRKNYLLRDGDRLARSMDCWTTFSQFQDADCLIAESGRG